ncbi:MAG: hypothetical protein CML16_00795 [Pusillimonas sp.]|nr:hypothetical protein [Pusillimonas sp.]
MIGFLRAFVALAALYAVSFGVSVAQSGATPTPTPRTQAAVNAANDIEPPEFDDAGLTPGDLGGQSGLPENLTQYTDNPGALLTDGAAMESDPITRAQYDSFFANNYDDPAFGEWAEGLLNRDDLEDILGIENPDVSQQCETEVITETREIRTTYYCSVDDGTGLEQPVCSRVRDYPVDHDYIYRCEEDRPTTTSEWSTECSGFQGNADCALLGEECTEYRDATTTEYRCEIGKEVEFSMYRCNSGEEVDIQSYTCERGENVQTSSYSCERGQQTETDTYSCERGENVQTSSYTCEQGQRLEITPYTCDRGTIERTEYYECTEEYGRGCDPEPGCRLVNESYGQSQDIIYKTYSCTTSSSYNNCQPPASCRETSRRCESRTPSGLCEREVVSYSCENPVTVDTCNAPSNCSQTSSSCAEYHNGSCIRYQRNYTCESSTSFNNCNAPSNCTQSGTTCLQRQNGRCVREQVNYTCETTSNYDNCNAPGNCSQTGTTCLEYRNGSCVRERVSYSCESSSSFNECRPDSNCSLTGTTCVERHNGRCIRERLNYSCETRTSYNTCSPDSLCEAVSTTCVRYSGGQCVEREHEYRCPTFSRVDTCTVPGCQTTGIRCVESFNGGCIRWEQEQVCPGDPAGCVGRAEDYRCENPAGPPPIDVIDEVGQPSWREQGCPRLDPEFECEVEGVYCVEGPETRIIDGVEIYDECWREETRYVCPGVGETVTDCNPDPSCSLVDETCLDDECRSTQLEYECVSESTSETSEEYCQSDISCFAGTCYSVDRENSAQQMPEALAKLAALFQAHESIGDTVENLRVMSGQDLRCHKTGIWKNCCTDDGIALDILGGSCSEDEQILAAKREENLCVDVGWYCAKRGIFGCNKRRRTSCCFNSVLARIINEEGHNQLGISWGTPEEPMCEGLTPEQFSQVNLDNVDFSEMTDQLMESFNPEGEGSMEERIRERVNNFYNNGAGG